MSARRLIDALLIPSALARLSTLTAALRRERRALWEMEQADAVLSARNGDALPDGETMRPDPDAFTGGPFLPDDD